MAFPRVRGAVTTYQHDPGDPDFLARLDEVIDEPLRCAQCDGELDPDGPDDTYCSERCQSMWLATAAGTHPDAAWFPGEWEPTASCTITAPDLTEVFAPFADALVEAGGTFARVLDNVMISLHTSPTSAPVGVVTETSGGSYARVALTQTGPNTWTNSEPVSITFPSPSVASFTFEQIRAEHDEPPPPPPRRAAMLNALERRRTRNTGPPQRRRNGRIL